MLLANAKIDAQKQMLQSKGKMVLICLLTAGLKLLFLCGFAVSVYTLAVLQSYARATANLYVQIGYYVLFALGAVLSVTFYAWTAFAGKRWFYKNAECPQPVSAFFVRLSFLCGLKTVYLFWLRKCLTLLYFLGYTAPFWVLAGAFWYRLRTGGMPTILFYASLAGLGILLLMGLYFAFVAVQRFFFCDGILLLDANKGVVQILAQGRAVARETAFAAANVKLRFALWGLSCVLVLPLFYVLPYYRQTSACMSKMVLDKNHLSPQTQKPIVFYCRRRSPA